MNRGRFKYDYLTGGIFVLIVILFFQIFYPYHLFFKEQTILFQNNIDYFLNYFKKPAWLSCYLGDFFVQFFYFKGGGALISGLLIGLVWYLAFLSFQKIAPSILSSSFALLIALSEFFLILNADYFLSGIWGIIVSLLTFLLWSRISCKQVSISVLVILVPFIYWIAGSHVFSFLFFVMACELNRKHKRKRYFFLGVLVLLGMAFSMVLRRIYLFTPEQALTYPYDVENILIIGLLVWGAVILYVCLVRVKRFSSEKVYLIALLFAVSGGVLGLGYFGDFKREKIFALGSEAYFGNWGKVYKLAERYELSNSISSYFANLSMVRLGIFPDKVLDFYQPFTKSLFLDVGPKQSWIRIFFSNEVYFMLGDMEKAQHSAQLGMIFSPNCRSSRMVRRLAEINIVLGEYKAAEKYIRMLNNSFFHKDYGRELSLIIKEMKSDCKGNWLFDKRKFLPDFDVLRKRGEEIPGLELLVQSNSNNSMALDYLLLYHLLDKDVVAFKRAFDKYYLQGHTNYPRIYSEALLVGLAKEDQLSRLSAQKYNISDVTKNRFMNYTRMFDLSESSFLKLKENFENSYWFYYHFFGKMRDE
ncbi:MAG: hypothetical protein PWQ06_570 [Anaerophaga sp.]|nr:hypothetical protein [Anaerophaga sp.]